MMAKDTKCECCGETGDAQTMKLADENGAWTGIICQKCVPYLKAEGVVILKIETEQQQINRQD